jgi:Flp pilus assembly protein CpaB
MRRNALVIVLGVLLMGVSVIGMLWVGQVANPPGVGLVIAARDLPAGTRLADLITEGSAGLLVDARARLDPAVARSLLLAEDVGRYADGVIVTFVPAGQPVPISAISSSQNPSAQALLVRDPGLVAMAIPMDRTRMPGAVRPGDFVDLVYGTTGSGPGPGLLPVGAGTGPQPQGHGLDAAEYAALAQAEPAGSGAPPVRDYLPLAKTIVTHAQVLEVVRDPAGLTANADGPVSSAVGLPVAVVLLIPRDAQEIVQFAVENGALRVTLLSATLNAETTAVGSRYPTLGMTWNDLVALLELERDARLAQGLPQDVLGPGATAIQRLSPSPRNIETR